MRKATPASASVAAEENQCRCRQHDQDAVAGVPGLMPGPGHLATTTPGAGRATRGASPRSPPAPPLLCGPVSGGSAKSCSAPRRNAGTPAALPRAGAPAVPVPGAGAEGEEPLIVG